MIRLGEGGFSGKVERKMKRKIGESVEVEESFVMNITIRITLEREK